MSVHTLSGAKILKEMGFTRVVLSREMSREEIKYIADNLDIELENILSTVYYVCVSVVNVIFLLCLVVEVATEVTVPSESCRLPL